MRLGTLLEDQYSGSIIAPLLEPELNASLWVTYSPIDSLTLPTMQALRWNLGQIGLEDVTLSVYSFRMASVMQSFTGWN